MKRVANNVARLRDARGLNQAQLAEMIGTTQPHISRIERGDAGIPILKFAQIAVALDVRLEDIFSEDGRTKAEQVLIETFRKLPEARQQGWLDMARALHLESDGSEPEDDQTVDRKAVE